jgi:hypothetical protein
MTSSDDDDLEHELGENLKLRRKLGTEEGAIDAKQGGGIAYRLGWVLYWICLALAVVWVWGLFWDLLSSFS